MLIELSCSNLPPLDLSQLTSLGVFYFWVYLLLGWVLIILDVVVRVVCELVGSDVNAVVWVSFER